MASPAMHKIRKRTSQSYLSNGKDFDILRDKKILVIYNDMSNWTREEKDVSLISFGELKTDFSKLELNMDLISIMDDVEGVIKKYNPRDTVIFNWCEGLSDLPNTYHLIPPILEKYGFVYTGADGDSLKLTTYKPAVKELLIKNYISTPIYKVYENADLNGWKYFPALVKPAGEHASYGITRDSVVDNLDALHERVKYIFETFKCNALVEDFIDSTEYNVAIWGNENPEILPLSSLDYSNFSDYHDRICTFEMKWERASPNFDKVKTICPAIVDDVLKKKIEQIALKTYKITNCRDYGRIDIKIRDGEPYVLDVNSNPDMSIDAGFFRSASCAGYTYGETFAKILCIALERSDK